MKDPLSEFDKFMLVGRAWELISHIKFTQCFLQSYSREKWIEILESPRGERVSKRLNEINTGYSDLIDIFNKLTPFMENRE